MVFRTTAGDIAVHCLAVGGEVMTEVRPFAVIRGQGLHGRAGADIMQGDRSLSEPINGRIGLMRFGMIVLSPFDRKNSKSTNRTQ